MKFDDYQKESRKTALYPDAGKNFVFPVIGLAGETGEVSEKIKKVIRDKDGIMDGEAKASIKKELGDVLWYIAQLATELDLSLTDIAKSNIDKINSRVEREMVSGDGDDR